MAQPEMAAGAPLESTEQAAAAFEDVLNRKPRDEAGRFASENTDDGDELPVDQSEAEDAPELEANEAEETTQEDEPDAPVIDPPVSWSAEDKAQWALLPPETQAIIARRESERDRAVQTKATEAAEARRSKEQADAAIQQLQQQYATQLQQFLAQDEPQRPDPAWLDTSVYGDEGPQTFYQVQAQYEAAIAQRSKAQQEYTRAQADINAKQAQAQQAYMAEQAQLLAERIPEWTGPKGDELRRNITEFARGNGYDDGTLAQASATDIELLHKAMLYDRLIADTKAKKVADKVQALPKVAKPGVSQPRGNAEQEQYNAARQRLKTSGHVRDAAAAFRNFV